MQDKEDHDGSGRRFKSLVGLVAMALAVTLALVVSRRLSAEARAVLAGAICALGLVITTGFLIVFVRQYHDEGRE